MRSVGGTCARGRGDDGYGPCAGCYGRQAHLKTTVSGMGMPKGRSVDAAVMKLKNSTTHEQVSTWEPRGKFKYFPLAMGASDALCCRFSFENKT